jgi:small RNA 2'-O-methyltransferase
VKGVDRKARRREAATREFLAGQVPSPMRGHGCSSSPLHEARLDAVTDALVESGAGTVLDLGCGSGALLRRLVVEAQFTRIVGVDTSVTALARAEHLLSYAVEAERVSLIHGSFASPPASLKGFDAAAMVETIEHVAPGDLSRVEQAVFGDLRPRTVVVTTPNRDYNVLYGLEDGTLRDADHRFEWCRARFRSWARGVAQRRGYRVEFADIGPADPRLGSPSQMGLFRSAGSRPGDPAESSPTSPISGSDR